MSSNGFRKMVLLPYKTKPDCDLYTTIDGHEVYHSNFNPNVYLIYNSDDKTYTAFEREDSKNDINEDLNTLVGELFG